MRKGDDDSINLYLFINKGFFKVSSSKVMITL